MYLLYTILTVHNISYIQYIYFLLQYLLKYFRYFGYFIKQWIVIRIVNFYLSECLPLDLMLSVVLQLLRRNYLHACDVICSAIVSYHQTQITPAQQTGVNHCFTWYRLIKSSVHLTVNQNDKYRFCALHYLFSQSVNVHRIDFECVKILISYSRIRLFIQINVSVLL